MTAALAAGVWPLQALARSRWLQERELRVHRATRGGSWWRSLVTVALLLDVPLPVASVPAGVLRRHLPAATSVAVEPGGAAASAVLAAKGGQEEAALESAGCPVFSDQLLYVQSMAGESFLGECSVGQAGSEGKSCDGDEGCAKSTSCYYTWDSSENTSTQLVFEKATGDPGVISDRDIIHIRDISGNQYLGMCGSGHEGAAAGASCAGAEMRAYAYSGRDCNDEFCTEFQILTPEKEALEAGSKAVAGQPFFLKSTKFGFYLCACGRVGNPHGNCLATGRIYGCSAGTGDRGSAGDNNSTAANSSDMLLDERGDNRLWRVFLPDCGVTTTTTSPAVPVVLRSGSPLLIEAVASTATGTSFGALGACMETANFSTECRGIESCDCEGNNGTFFTFAAGCADTVDINGVRINKDVPLGSNPDLEDGDVVSLQSHAGFVIGLCGWCVSSCSDEAACVAGFDPDGAAADSVAETEALRWTVKMVNFTGGPLKLNTPLIFRSESNPSLALCVCSGDEPRDPHAVVPPSPCFQAKSGRLYACPVSDDGTSGVETQWQLKLPSGP